MSSLIRTVITITTCTVYLYTCHPTLSHVQQIVQDYGVIAPILSPSTKRMLFECNKDRAKARNLLPRYLVEVHT